MTAEQGILLRMIIATLSITITITDINLWVFEINHLLPQRKGVYKCLSLGPSTFILKSH